ncbi:MAG: FG-GAP repeat domain-containing protein [Candidatus Hodarchaeales archaeon]
MKIKRSSHLILLYSSILCFLILGGAVYYGFDTEFNDRLYLTVEDQRPHPELVLSSHLPLNSSSLSLHAIAQPILADLNDDNILDIITILRDDHVLNVLNGSGVPLPGWPYSLPSTNSLCDPPVCAEDFLQNNEVELVVPLGISSNLTFVLVFDSKGHLLQNHSLHLDIINSSGKMLFLPSFGSLPPQVCLWSRGEYNQSSLFLITPFDNSSRMLSLPLTKGSLVSVLPVQNSFDSTWLFYLLFETAEVISITPEGIITHNFTHSTLTNSTTQNANLFLFSSSITDSNLSLLCLNRSGLLIGWTLLGSELASWTHDFSYQNILWDSNFPVIADLNGDNQNELLLVGNRGLFYVFNTSGDLFPGGDFSFHSALAFTNPFLVDFNFDGLWEIVLVEYLYGPAPLTTAMGFYSANGSVITHWFEELEFRPSGFQKIVVGDVTGNNFSDLIYISETAIDGAKLVVVSTNWVSHALWPTPPCYPLKNQLKDSDHDGLTDSDEYFFQTKPLLSDSDADGLIDGAELGKWGTNPLNANCDSDRLNDGAEVLAGYNPLFSGDNSFFFPERVFYSFFLPNRKAIGRILFGLGIGAGVISALIIYSRRQKLLS